MKRYSVRIIIVPTIMGEYVSVVTDMYGYFILHTDLLVCRVVYACKF